MVPAGMRSNSLAQMAQTDQPGVRSIVAGTACRDRPRTRWIIPAVACDTTSAGETLSGSIGRRQVIATSRMVFGESPLAPAGAESLGDSLRSIERLIKTDGRFFVQKLRLRFLACRRDGQGCLKALGTA